METVNYPPPLPPPASKEEKEASNKVEEQDKIKALGDPKPPKLALRLTEGPKQLAQKKSLLVNNLEYLAKTVEC